MEESLAILIDQIPLGIITYSLNGDVEYINQNFQKYGILYQYNVPHQKINVFQTDIFPSFSLINELKNIIKGQPFEKEISRVETKSGGFISLIVKGSPIYDGENISGGILLVEDLKVLSDVNEELKIKSKVSEDFIERGDEFLIVTDLSGHIKYSAGKDNPKLKLSRKEITGKNIGEVFNSSSKQIILETFSSVIKYRKSQIIEFELKHENEFTRVSCKIDPVISEKGDLQFLYLLFKEIKEEEKNIYEEAEEFKESEQFKKLEAEKQIVLLINKQDGEINFRNEHFEKLILPTKDETTGKIILDFFPSISLTQFKEILKKLESENTHELVTTINDKENKSIKLKLTFIKSETDKPFVILTCTELYEEEVHEKRIKAKPSEIETINEPFCKIDYNGSILFANQALKSKLNFPDIELYTKNFFKLIVPLTEIDLRNEFLSLTTGELKSFPVKIKNFSGVEEEFNLTFKIETFENGNPSTFYCYLGEVFDIEVERTESVYTSLFKAAQDGLAVSENDKIIIANNSFAKIFGYKIAEDMENKNVLELVSKADMNKVRDYLIRVKNGIKAQERIEFLARKKDDSTFYAEISVAGFKDQDKSLLIILATDATERKRTQRVLRESEQRYRDITENIDDFLYIFERVGNNLRPVFYTSAVQKVTGYTQDEFLSDTRLLLKIIHPDDFHGIKDKIGLLWKSLDQVTSDLELRIINKDGNVVWVRNKVNLVRDANGKIQKVYGLVSDITLNKRAEEELKQSAENLKKLNEAKDRFLSIISHDLRTPFSSILGFTDLLLDDDTISETERKQYISYIQDSSKAMLALVNSLLDWTRLQTGRIKFEPERINARELVDRSISTVSGNSLKKGIKIENLVDSTHHLFVDKSLALQVFNNLLSNAVKFTKRGDSVTISAKASPILRFLQFSVNDTGKGIKPENLGKLFNIDTKFTSEGTAGEKGSGLGLSLVKEIILKHGGTIEAKSEFEKGSEFIFDLPVASAKILIVDHNKRDRLLYSKILMNIAPEYAVSIVSNGREALERINISPPALIITEHEMPVMNGYNLVRELLKRGLKAVIPVIVLTNKIERVSKQYYNELGIENIFTKPVNLRSFKEAIEKSIRKSMMNNNHST